MIIFPNGGMLRPMKGAGIRMFNIVKTLSNKNKIMVLESDVYEHISPKESIILNKNHYFFNDFKIKNMRFGISFLDYNPSFLLRFLKILKTEEVDIIQVAFPFGIVGIKFLSLVKGYKIPIIYDAHNVQKDLSKITATRPGIHSLKKFVMLYYGPTLEAIAVNLVEHVISVSNDDREKFIEMYSLNPEKITVIPSGTEIVNEVSLRDRNMVRGELGFKPGEIIVVFHGTYTYPPNKEAIDLITDYIAPKMGEVSNNVKFVMAGKDVPEFEGSNLKGFGFVENLYDFLNASDIAIVPLLQGGGTKLKIFDYMSVGIPIISTKKGMEGIIAKNGEEAIIVGDVNEGLIEAIKYLVDNEEERKRLGANARRLAEEEYDWDKIGEKLDGLYRSILDGN